MNEKRVRAEEVAREVNKKIGDGAVRLLDGPPSHVPAFASGSLLPLGRTIDRARDTLLGLRVEVMERLRARILDAAAVYRAGKEAAHG